MDHLPDLRRRDLQVVLMRWIESGSMGSEWAIRLDRLTAIMLVVVNSVSALVHLYSFGYMAHDDNWRDDEPYRARFFAYLSFFTFSMLMLVTSDNLIQMFFGWEGVGVASYLLIGFYYKKPSANAAAIKAFVVNRVGDFGFALGIFALFFLTDSVSFDVSSPPPGTGANQPHLPLGGMERGEPDRGAAVHRGDGEIGAAVPAHLAARRDGGADARFRADPRGHDGDGRGLPRLPHVAAL
jgi:NADH:ubiquinone oxidoreductase subunit 5 (subunit L)/multisubunit Na+/H+ antiporter MnhA subunit